MLQDNLGVAHLPQMDDKKHESAASRMSRSVAPIKQNYIKVVSKQYRELIQTDAIDAKPAGQVNSKASKVASERKSRRAFKKVCPASDPNPKIISIF